MKRVMSSVTAIILMAIAGIFLLFIIASMDVSAPDLTDLIVERPIIPPNKNAYTYFEKAVASLYWVDDSDDIKNFLSDEPCNKIIVKEIISKNKETLKWIDKGVKCKVCQVPEITGFDTELPLSYKMA